MKIYFVRHGESEGNVSKIYQHNETALTPQGEKQARTLAKRFLHIPIDLIISSDLKRAKQTSEILV